MKSEKLKNQKSFFLISFIPAIAYWYLEESYSLRIALAGGLVLALIEMIVEKIFTKHVHQISKLNFTLILFLGGISYLGDEGVWFKLQPFFTGQILGGYLLFKRSKGLSLFEELMAPMLDKTQKLNFDIKLLELHLAIFFMLYGLLMAFLAIYAETSSWLFWKTVGFYLCSFLFMLIEFVFFVRKKG